MLTVRNLMQLGNFRGLRFGLLVLFVEPGDRELRWDVWMGW